MSKKLTRSRELQFSDWEEVLEDVEHLLKQGYTTSGSWTLGQAASHLAQWTSFPIDGYPKPPIVIRALFGVMRGLGVTKRLSEKILKDGFQPGSPTSPSTVPPSRISDKEGGHQLKNAFIKARTHNGPLHPSPLFGEMNLDSYKRVSLLHAAHHLGFFKPKMQ